MADATEVKTESPNTVTIEDAGPSRKKLTIEIPAAEVDAKLGDSLDTLASEADLPGFRKGRAPRRLIEKRFGSAVRDEAKNQLIAGAYSQAIERHELKVVGDPVGDELADLKVEPGQALTFSIEVEVVPDFELPELKGLKLYKPDATLPDGLVDKELEKIAINEGSLEERDDPEAGDYLSGHGIMVDADGTEHYNIPGAVVRIPPTEDEGRGMILGVMVDDFSKQLGTPKAGETATVKVKGPENHENEAIRGKDLTVTFKVDRVDRILPAPLTDVVAKSGRADEAQLRELVTQRLEQRATTQQQVVLRQQVSRELLDKVDFELPENMTAAQAQRTLERRRMELMYRGMDESDIETRMAELRAASGEQAVRDLKLFFVLSRAAEQREIKVDETEINARIVQIAREQGRRPEQVRQEIIQHNRVGLIFQQIQEHKVMDAIIADADVEEVSADKFNEMMKDKADAHD